MTTAHHVHVFQFPVPLPGETYLRGMCVCGEMSKPHWAIWPDLEIFSDGPPDAALIRRAWNEHGRRALRES